MLNLINNTVSLGCLQVEVRGFEAFGRTYPVAAIRKISYGLCNGFYNVSGIRPGALVMANTDGSTNNCLIRKDNGAS